MLDDILSGQEFSKSLLVIDDFQNEGSMLLYSIISKLTQRKNTNVNLYPTNKRFENAVKKFLIDKRRLENLCLKQSPLNSLSTGASDLTNTPNEKNVVVVDDANLMLLHYDNDAFRLFEYVRKTMSNPDVNLLVMVVHKDTVDESILHQFTNLFQSVVLIDQKITNKPTSGTVKLSSKPFSFKVKLSHRNLRSSKYSTQEETVNISDEFEITDIQKQIKTLKPKEVDTSIDDQLSSLTFKIHTNSNDLEVKNNLILPYEIVGKGKQNASPGDSKIQVDNSSKIYYEPDERDDVDDDDPDEDLNF